jgi:hypothetical protein
MSIRSTTVLSRRSDTDLAQWLIEKIDLARIRQIVIEAEPPDDAQSLFRLSIDANLIAKGVTAAQALSLVDEVLGRIALPEHAETVTFDADGCARESVRVPSLETPRRSSTLQLRNTAKPVRPPLGRRRRRRDCRISILNGRPNEKRRVKGVIICRTMTKSSNSSFPR